MALRPVTRRNFHQFRAGAEIVLEARRKSIKTRERKTIRLYVCIRATVGSSLRVLDWIGLPRQQYKHSKPRCGSASPVPVSNWNYTFPSTTFDLPQYIATCFPPWLSSFVHIELINNVHESVPYLSILQWWTCLHVSFYLTWALCILFGFYFTFTSFYLLYK